MNILIVHNYYQIAGGEDTVVANESAMLKKNGHKVILYKRDNSELKTMSTLSKLGLPFTTIYNKKTADDICALIKSEKIDVIHVHNTLNLVSAAVYYAARKSGVPIVQTIHNYRLMCPKATFYRDSAICEDCINKNLFCALKHKCYRDSFAQTLVCALATKIHRMKRIYSYNNYICLTEFGKSKLLMINKDSKRKMIDPDKVFIKPNFMPAGNKEPVAFADRKNRFVYAGRLDETKGVDFLLKSWKVLCDNLEFTGKNSDNIELVICGEGPLEKWCSDFVANEKLKNVTLMGKVSHEKVIELLKYARVMILPTRWYECFPMSIAESFSVGTPVIGPDMGNVGAILVNELSGLKYDLNDDRGLADCLLRFAGLRDIEKMYEGAYKEYLYKYTEEINYRTLMDIYGKVSGK